MSERRPPAYEQVADTLRARIADRTYPPGQPLPSEPDLAAEFGSGKDTVRDALALLVNEGLLVTRRGYRAIVRETPQREQVTVPPGASITARMPTPAERRELGIDGPGIPVLIVGDRMYPADRAELVADPTPTYGQ